MMEFHFERVGKTRKTKIVLKNGAEQSFATSADLLNEAERSKVVRAVQAKFPQLDPDEIEDRLEHEAARTDTASAADSQASMLVKLAHEKYRFGQSETGWAFACLNSGLRIALPLKGSRNALRNSLAREFNRRHGKPPSSTALAEAMTVLEGDAAESSREPVNLRVARCGERIVLDLGRLDGQAIVIGPDSWELAESPVLFRRSPLVAEMPLPERGGSVEELRALLNVDADSWKVLVGWIIAAWIPDIPHPLLLLGGEQGTGKSTAARMIANVIDTSPAPLRSQPREQDQWAVSAFGSWVVPIDNVSTIPPWWSDALCKAVTGDGWVKREHYADLDPIVLSFRRVLILTSIDAGALRGDLGDRILPVDLERIEGDSRRSERELEAEFRRLQPRILGAFLDLLARVLRELPRVSLPTHPRMADFARVLAAVDLVEGTDSLSVYLRQAGRVAQDVIEGDPVGVALMNYLRVQGEFTGTASELLKALEPYDPGGDLPKHANMFSGQLKRLAPALRLRGISIERERTSDDGRRRQLTIRTLTEPKAIPPDACVDLDLGTDDPDCPDDAPRYSSDSGANE